MSADFQEERTFAARLDGLSEGVEFLNERLESGQCDLVTANKLQIAFDEIGSNIVRHSGAETFDLRVERKGDVWSLVCSDSGRPWNPLTHVDPDVTLPANDRQPGGLGLLMVKRLMDSVEYAYEGGRNVLTLRKGPPR